MESKGTVDRKEKKKKSKGQPKAPPEPLAAAPAEPEPKVPETQDVKMRSKKVSLRSSPPLFLSSSLPPSPAPLTLPQN